MFPTLAEKTKTKILEGDFPGAERDFYRERQQDATQEFQAIVVDAAGSEEGRGVARALKDRHGYQLMRRKEVTITTMTGDAIRIPSWYAVKKGKKRGRKKPGPHGRGDHLLLRWWGFHDFHSPNYTSIVARSAVAAQSYQLAAADLKEHGIIVTDHGIANVVERLGSEAAARRDTVALAPDDRFTGKRVIVAIDGGRTRMREDKAGRMKNDQKIRGFSAPWREPKLLVMAELDEEGKYRKGTKPIYEATISGHDAIFNLLHDLARRTDLKDAREIVLSGDGAVWIWQKFAWLQGQLGIRARTTEILDFYHATEHLTAICEANTTLAEQDRKRWFQELRELLRAGDAGALKANIEKESQAKGIPRLMELFQYFERNRERMRYDVYEKNRQPIGSGIVESAIRRVINLKLKSPSTFWRPERLERMLQLRCALMAGRWRIFMDNLIQAVRLELI